jgi:hypothetical protein
MTLYVAPVIEGHTEVACIERLLHRVWNDLLAAPARLQVLPATRGHRSSLVRDSHPELAQKVAEGQIKLASQLRRDPTGRGLLLLLLDADEDCPATLGPELLTRARAARGDMDIACVLPKRELENWFKAAAASLAGVGGLPDDLVVPPDPEVGSGDTWLTQQMQKRDRRRKYTKPADALELAKSMDLQQCRDNSPSFDKLCRDLAARLPGPSEPESADVPSPQTEVQSEAAPEEGEA